MPEFMKGLQLCEGFFNEVAKPILSEAFPNLMYTAGLIGYGSDVLGYDDEVSTDHMWGPRFYLFIEERDRNRTGEILESFSKRLPYSYRGYSVNFSSPDEKDHGVRVPEPIDQGDVHPLIFITTFDDFLEDYLGICRLENMDELDWLSVSEHKLLAFTSGRLFHDNLKLDEKLQKLRFYPTEVVLYLIASQWSLIAEEQAFVKRCGSVGDDIGSRIICGRIVERLMRLCFLYCGKYAPYSKWFGTAFNNLDIPIDIKCEMDLALKASKLVEREAHLVKAQALVGVLHNSLEITDRVEVEIRHYFGRDIQVIFGDQIAEKTRERLIHSQLFELPLIGALHQVGNFSTVTENKELKENIKFLYKRDEPAAKACSENEVPIPIV